MDLHVPRAFELLENNFIHSAAGIDESRSNNRQASAVLDIPGGAEKFLGLMKRVGVHATGENLSARRNYRIVSASQARDAVQKNNDIFSMFDQTLSLLDDHFSDLNVPRSRFIKR